jgi:hypothetical protein
MQADPNTAGIENNCIVRLVPYLCLKIPANTHDSIEPIGMKATISPN